MDEPTPSSKPPFVAGLPDAPLQRPSDFPGYDGPLVCPFYGPDHPARRDEESKEAFNEDVARVAFGEVSMAGLLEIQSWRPPYAREFAGDYWLLSVLSWVVSNAQKGDPEGVDSYRFEDFRFIKHGLRDVDVMVHLEGAQLERTRLQHIDLEGAHCQHAELRGAALEHAKLSFAHLDGANCEAARLNHAILFLVTLEKAILSGTEMRHAVLMRARLAGAVLEGATLDNANVRLASGLLFDDTAVQRLDIEGNAPDPWSTLRRTYTGPMFFVHLLLLVGFLLPYTAKVLTLTMTARGYDALRRSLEAAEGVPAGAEVVRGWLDRFDASHSQVSAWKVLLGWTHDWWWLMGPTAVCIILYNFSRGYLTLNVGVLRDQTDRVERTPTIEEYYGPCHPLALEDAGWRRIPAVWRDRVRDWIGADEHTTAMRWRWRNRALLWPWKAIGLYRLHLIARVLFWISIASVILHVGSWLLTTTVPVPK